MEAFPVEHNYRNIMSIQQGGLNPQQRPTIEELKVQHGQQCMPNGL